MAALATAAQRAVIHDSDMPKLSGQATRTQQELIVGDHSATNTRADGEVNQVVVTLASAVAPFTQGSQVGIVAKDDRHLETILRICRKGRFFQPGMLGAL